MDPIEILNTLAGKVFELRNQAKLSNETQEFEPYVNPKDRDENVYKINRESRRYEQYDNEQYLRDMIGYFLIHASAIKKKDILAGYSEARQRVIMKPGFGRVGDIQFRDLSEPSRPKTHIIRIVDSREKDISFDERREMAVRSQSGDYVRVNTIEDFYKWYVDKFGEVF